MAKKKRKKPVQRTQSIRKIAKSTKLPKEKDVSSLATQTKCICPKCGGEHSRLMHWTGRGDPRKYCRSCVISYNLSEEPIWNFPSRTTNPI